MSPTGTFQFVRIPADPSEPIEALLGEKSGGLEKDYLVDYAKRYFYKLTNADSSLEFLEDATPEGRQTILDSFRDQATAMDPAMRSQFDGMDDDAVFNLIRQSQQHPSCDITAVTVPTAANGHQAVSLYAVDPSQQYDLPFNVRAVELLAACGYAVGVDDEGAPIGIYGDVFVGRAHDDEGADIWERIDFTIQDADPMSKWCRVARSPGGGGGGGSGKPANATSIHNMLKGDRPQHDVTAIDGRPGNATAADKLQRFRYGMNGAPPVREDWGTWNQTDDEVDVRIAVPLGTKAKQCDVQFNPNRIKITVAGQVILEGSTFNAIVPDECTFTLEDTPGVEGRELCITIGKKEAKRIWAWVAK